MLPLFMLLSLGAGTALAGFQPARWELVRPIQAGGTPGAFVSVLLDRQILESARADLADLRVIGPDREEVPYFLKPETAPLEGASFRIERDPVTKMSTIVIDCGYLHARAAVLEFDFEDQAFRRRYTILGRDVETLLVPAGNAAIGEAARRDADVPWLPAGGGEFARQPPGRRGGKGIDETRIVLAGVTARFLRVVMEDGDDRPLRLRGMRAQGTVQRLVFPVRAGGTSFLYYGNPDASPPRYDGRGSLPEPGTLLPATATLGAARPNPLRGVVPDAPAGESRPWKLRVVMLAAFAALVYLVIRSVRTPSSAT